MISQYTHKDLERRRTQDSANTEDKTGGRLACYPPGDIFRTVTVTDPQKVLDSLTSGEPVIAANLRPVRRRHVFGKDFEATGKPLTNNEPVTMKDAVLRPVNSQKRKKLLDSVTFFEAQLARLQKQARDMRAEILSLTVSDD